MRQEVRRIRKHYETETDGRSEQQMSQDIDVLIRYIDSLEEKLARRMACDAIRAMAQAWEEAEHQLLQ